MEPGPLKTICHQHEQHFVLAARFRLARGARSSIASIDRG
jgi:hypothetical protein